MTFIELTARATSAFLIVQVFWKLDTLLMILIADLRLLPEKLLCASVILAIGEAE